MRLAWLAVLVGASACTRSDAEWRQDLTNPASEPFERGLAAIALAEHATSRTDGVPTVLLEVLDGPPGRMQARAGEVLRTLGPAACEEMAFCLVNNTFFADDSRSALEAALVRNGAAAVPHLAAVLPAAADARAERVGGVVAAIGEPAVDPLLAILREEPPSPIEVAAVRLLARLGPVAQRAIPDVERAAASSRMELAGAALACLVRLDPGGERSELALRSALASAEPERHADAVQAFVRLALNRVRTANPQARERLVRETVGLGDAALPMVLDALSHARAKESAFASDVLLAAGLRWSVLGPRERFDAARLAHLEQQLAGTAGSPRRQAALDLARAGRHAAPAAAALFRAMGDPDRGVRFCASLALALVAIDVARLAALSAYRGSG